MENEENKVPRKKGKKDGAGAKIGILIGLIVVMVALIAVLIFLILKTTKKDDDDSIPAGNKPNQIQSSSTTENSGDNESDSETQSQQPPVSTNEVIQKASVTAAMYDYDGAIEYVKTNYPSYADDPEAMTFITDCEAKKSQLVKWPDNTQITHVFYHSLIENCQDAFNSSSRDNYNQVMTTIEEFNKITQKMYDEGYVMVRLSDIAAINPDTGKMEYKPIYLPAGKTPFVLSEDDVSYYEYMNADGGFPHRLVVTEDGKIMNEKDNADGTVTVGAFDVVPLIDQFVEQHPDFSYHGAKGIVALTGYNGILGYRTSYICYGTENDLKTVWDPLFNAGGYDSATAISLARDAHSYDNPNLMADREKAKNVAAAMKADGWEFASHTWGHMNMGSVVDSATGNIVGERFYRDTAWWDVEVNSLLGGDVNTIIFAFGADIHTWQKYDDNNQAYLYLKNKGFDYYCNVDSSQYFVQLSDAGGSGSLRQGRRNLDGQLMFKAILYPELHLLDDLFDPKTVFDPVRPLPVAGVTVPDGYDLSKLLQ